MKLLVPISSLMYLHVYSFFKNSDQCKVKSVRSDARIDEKEYYFFWTQSCMLLQPNELQRSNLLQYNGFNFQMTS